MLWFLLTQKRACHKTDLLYVAKIEMFDTLNRKMSVLSLVISLPLWLNKNIFYFVLYIHFCNGFQRENVTSYFRRKFYFDNQVFLERLSHLLLKRNIHRFEENITYPQINSCPSVIGQTFTWTVSPGLASFPVSILKVSPSSRTWRPFYLANNPVIMSAREWNDNFLLL